MVPTNFFGIPSMYLGLSVDIANVTIFFVSRQSTHFGSVILYIEWTEGFLLVSFLGIGESPPSLIHTREDEVQRMALAICDHF